MPEYPTFDFNQVDFVTSDTHSNHARIIELAGRPFASVQDMDAELIRRWNETVAPDDVVLHLGDLALGPIAESLPLTAQLHGRRFLVPGNHDRVPPRRRPTAPSRGSRRCTRNLAGPSSPGSCPARGPRTDCSPRTTPTPETHRSTIATPPIDPSTMDSRYSMATPTIAMTDP